MPPERRIDDSPPPRTFRRTEPDPGSIPRARPTAEVSGRAPSEAKLRRLRRMAVIWACRTAADPIPYSTLIVILGISERHAIRLFKAACQRKLRRSRV